MIEAVVKSSVILLMALGALPLLRRQSAALRHAILTVGLVCALAVPVLSPLIPSWPAAGKFGDRSVITQLAFKNHLIANWVITDLSPNFPLEWSDTEFL